MSPNNGTNGPPKSLRGGGRPGQLVIVGTGLKTVGHLTTEAIAWIRAADKVLYVVGDTVAEEVIHSLNPKGAESLQTYYQEGQPRIHTYQRMVERILECVREGLRVCGAFYGHPGVFVYPSHEAVRLARLEGYSAIMLPGVSAEDCLFADLGIDPATTGCQSFEATDFLLHDRPIDPSCAVVLWQVGILCNVSFTAGHYDQSCLPHLVRKLTRWYPAEHQVIPYEAAVQLGCLPKTTPVPLHSLPRANLSAATTLFIPAAVASRPDPEFLGLSASMGWR